MNLSISQIVEGHRKVGGGLRRSRAIPPSSAMVQPEPKLIVSLNECAHGAASPPTSSITIVAKLGRPGLSAAVISRWDRYGSRPVLLGDALPLPTTRSGGNRGGLMRRSDSTIA